MRLTAETWTCDDGHKHTVVKAKFNTNDIAKAKHVADQKVKYINVHSPGGIRRPPAVIHSRIIAGKLADYAVEKLLRVKSRERNLQVTVSEYDQVRDDEFRRFDQYDLRCVTPARSWDVEVRSSFSYQLHKEQRIISRLSIYGWYVSQDKPEEPHRDFYWQVIYHMRPQDVPPKVQWPNLPIFEQQLNAGDVTGFIIGGATKEMLEDSALSVVRPDQDRASYQSISPACNGLDVPAILQATLTGP